MQSLSKDTFAPGETASFIYSVVNEGSNTVAVSRYGCEDFAANILQGPKLVKFLGQHSGGCGGSVKTEYLNPGETRAFAATWDLTNEDGSQTPPGEYEATFELKYNFGSPGETNFAPQELIVATPLHFLITAQKKR